MTKNRHAMDGITPPAKRRRLDDFSGQNAYSPERQPSKNGTNQPRARSSISDTDQPRQEAKIGIEENAPVMKHEVTEEPVKNVSKPKRRWFGLRKPKMTKAEKKEWKKNLPRHRKVLRRSMFAVGSIAALFVVFVGLKGWTTLTGVIDRAGAGSPLLGDAISPSQLAGEGDGRVNILMAGIADQGGADTVMVASVDPINKEAALLSIPRDLVVTNPLTGGRFKINSAYAQLDDDNGLQNLEEIVEESLGINIHYYAAADFEGVERAVNAINGISITLDEQINTLYSPEYGRALSVGPGLVELDGVDTLLLGRNRQYPEGDVVRNDVQRDILFAVKDKVLSLGTLANPLKLLEILDSVGGHFRTNLQPSDMLRLKELAEEVPQDKILSYGLSSRADNYLVVGSPSLGLGFTFVPKAGDFSEIQDFVRSIFVDGFIKEEAAVVDVLNGTLTGGLAGTKADELSTFGYTIGAVGNAPENVKTTRIYDLSGNNPFTKRYLEQRFIIESQSAENLPAGITSTADFVIILGTDAVTTES